MGRNPILDFEIDRSQIDCIGEDLHRPECILAEQNGTLWVADARGGIVRIFTDGKQELITQKASNHFEKAENDAVRYLEGTLPNGLAFSKNGKILIANFGNDCLEIMERDGTTRVLIDNIDGEPIGKVNFVLRDSKDRIWVTITTKMKNWMHALRADLSDGYIACLNGGVFRIVADGFRFTNECRFDAKEEWLYVVETTGGCISRLRVDERGKLHDREIFGPSKLGKGAWPDGIAFDSYGNLWGTMVYSDKLFVLTPDGDIKILLDEGDPHKVEILENAFLKGQVTEEVLFATGQGIAPWMSSVTFAGEDLRTLFIGSLKGKCIPRFQSPIPGLAMVHWNERH